jgi:tetratricopeptide (TPR) repeat protein
MTLKELNTYVLTLSSSAKIGILLLVTGFAYLPGLLNGFVFDEKILLLPVNAYWDVDLLKIFSTPVNGFEYLPVRDFTLAIDAWLWGKNPVGFHLSSLLYYLITVWLVFVTTKQLVQSAGSGRAEQLALMTAAIFALHPLNSEAVYFISARNNILAMLFLLLSLAGFLAGRYFLPLLAFSLALFSKASAVFFPLALLVILLTLPNNKVLKKIQWKLLGFMFVINVVVILIHLQIASDRGMLQPDLTRLGILDPEISLRRAILIPAYYLGRFIVPWPLSIVLDEASLVKNYSGLLVATLLSIAYLSIFFLLWKFRHKSILPFIGFSWFFIALGPVSNLFPTSPMIAERYIFPALFGLALTVSSFFTYTSKSLILRYLIALLLCTWLITVNVRGSDWRSDQSLWESAYKVNPPLTEYQYFTSLMSDRDYDDVSQLPHFEKMPIYLRELLAGEIASRKKDYPQALKHYLLAEKLVSINADLVQGHVFFNIASTYEQLDQHMAAISYYLKISDSRLKWSSLFYEDKIQKRVSMIREVLSSKRKRLDNYSAKFPDNVVAQGEFGLYLLRTGEYQLAIKLFIKADQLQPDNFGILYNLGLANLKNGDIALALQAFLQANAIKPGNGKVLNHLALIYSQQENYTKAISTYQKALSAGRDNFNARINLVRLYYRLGMMDKADRILQLGIDNAPDDVSEQYQLISNSISRESNQ